MKHSWLILVWMVCALWLTAACVQELPGPLPGPVSGGDPFPEGKQVTVNFSIPAPEWEAGTKSIDEGGELKTLHLAVFGSSGYLKEYVKARRSTEDVGTYDYTDPYGKIHHVPLIKFSATLTLSEKSRIIHFVGNGPATLPYDADTTVMTTLMSEGGDGGFWQIKRMDCIGALKDEQGHYIDDQGHIIQDGTGYVPDGPTSDSLNHVALVRNWAKISLYADPESSNFVPESFAVVNVPSKGTIAPLLKGPDGHLMFVENYHKQSFEDLSKVLKYPASLPDEALFIEDIPETFIPYNGGNGVAFLYERPVPNEHLKETFVIVYGEYKGDHQKYYYKIDLAQNGFYYPIYRNFNYKIIITNVGSKGFSTPRGAAESVGGVDISADVSTTHLGDISDGTAQLSVRPWMSHSFYIQQNNNDILGVKFYNNITVENVEENDAYQDSIKDGQKVTKTIGEQIIDVISNDPDPVNNPVTWELLPPEDNLEGDVITDVFIGHWHVDGPADPAEVWDHGWRKIFFSTIPPATGTQARTQTLRISASFLYNQTPRTLFRDIQITVLPRQHMKLRCEKPELEDEIGAEQTLTILIPEGLPQSMFPLDFTIEPEEMTLMPALGSNMPVVYGTSIAVPPVETPTGTFQFVRSLSYAEYTDPSGTSVKDPDDGSMWRSFSSVFVATRTENATKIWVANDYFETNSTSFENEDKHFRNLTIPPFEPSENGVLPSGYEFRIHFDVEESYKNGYPEIMMDASNVTVVSGLPYDAFAMANGDGTYFYVYTPTQNAQDLVLRTTEEITEENGTFSLRLSARPEDHYAPVTIALRRFTECRFMDGIRSESLSLFSNVMFGYINTDEKKAAPFGFCDDPDYPADLQLKKADGSDQAFSDLSYSGRPAVGIPTVDDFASDPSYHEIGFKTKGGVTGPVSFRLVAPSYLSKTISAGRFTGKVGNYNSYAIDNSKLSGKTEYTYNFNENANNFNVRVVFDRTVSVVGGYLKLARSTTDETETFKIKFQSKTSGYKPLYYVEITFVEDQPIPLTMVPDVGTVSKYRGTSTARYIWNFPVENRNLSSDSAEHTLTFTSKNDIRIEKIVVRGVGKGGATFTP